MPTTDQVALYQRAYKALRHSVSNIYADAEEGANNWLLFKAILITVPGEPAVTKTLYIPMQVRRSYSYNVTKLVLDQIDSGIATTLVCDGLMTNTEVANGGQFLQSLVAHYMTANALEKNDVLSHHYTHMVCACATNDVAVAIRCDEVIVMTNDGQINACANCPEYHTAYGQWLTLYDPNTTDLGPDGTPEADEDSDSITGCCGNCSACAYGTTRPFSICNNQTPESDYALELAEITGKWYAGKPEYPIYVVGLMVTGENANDATSVTIKAGDTQIASHEIHLRAGDTASFFYNPPVRVSANTPIYVDVPGISVGSLSIRICYNRA